MKQGHSYKATWYIPVHTETSMDYVRHSGSVISEGGIAGIIIKLPSYNVRTYNFLLR